MRPIAELCVADVDLSHAPLPKEEKRRGRDWRYTSEEYHAWMLERERD